MVFILIKTSSTFSQYRNSLSCIIHEDRTIPNRLSSTHQIVESGCFFKIGSSLRYGTSTDLQYNSSDKNLSIATRWTTLEYPLIFCIIFHHLPQSKPNIQNKSSNTTRVPSGYWKEFSNHRAFMDDVGKKLNITSSDGWYNITHNKLMKHGASALLQHYSHSPSKLLTTVYPEYPPYQYRI